MSILRLSPDPAKPDSSFTNGPNRKLSVKGRSWATQLIVSIGCRWARSGSILALLAAATVRAESPAEQKILDGIKSQELSVVHLWAPWCSNCQTELKSGGWLKTVKANPDVKFYFVSVWNGGEDGRAVLTKYELANQPNVTILADPGPRTGDAKIKRFLDLPLSWIPTTWVYKGGDLRYALNYGEIRFDVLQQFFADSNSKW